MKLILKFICIAVLAVSCKMVSQSKNNASIGDAYKGKFYIGTAMNLPQIHGEDQKSLNIIKKDFTAVVPENCMKSMFLQPEEGKFFFDDADKFVNFGVENGKFITGHVLIWHSQAPDWFFVDKNGKNVSPEVLKQRMKSHINTVVSRYKGKIKGWDVVNEAIMEDGSYRKSKFYEILGEEFIPLAFQYAHETDPNAELYYNDYNEWHEGKRKAIKKLIQDLKKRGLRIDAIGMQAHFGMDTPTLAEYEATIKDYIAEGVHVSITELDLSPLPSPWGTSANISDTQQYQEKMNPYKNGLPKDVESAWDNHLVDFFKLFLKYEKYVDRVTFWGVSDADSWKNDFPIKGRTDYPLIFDRNFKAKPVVQKLIDLAKENK